MDLTEAYWQIENCAMVMFMSIYLYTDLTQTKQRSNELKLNLQIWHTQRKNWKTINGETITIDALSLDIPSCHSTPSSIFCVLAVFPVDFESNPLNEGLCDRLCSNVKEKRIDGLNWNHAVCVCVFIWSIQFQNSWCTHCSFSLFPLKYGLRRKWLTIIATQPHLRLMWKMKRC